MNEVVVNVVAEINRLHSELEATKQKLDAMAGGVLEKAISIGEMLTDQKAALKHGEWLLWLKANVGFSHQMACRYMKVYGGRDKCKPGLHLNQVHRLLAGPKRKEKPEPEKETEQETSSQPERSATHQPEISAAIEPQLSTNTQNQNTATPQGAPVRQPGKAMEYAAEAITALRKIRNNDSARRDAFATVAKWIDDNE